MNSGTYTIIFDGIMVKYCVGEHGISIIDSFQVKDDDMKKEILTDICLNVEGLELCRTFKSMFREWKVHNIFYSRGWFKKRTKDTDLEYKQKRIVAWFYTIVSKLLKEK